jgi:hypothetical protein
MQITSPRFHLNTPLSLRSGMRPTPPSADNRLHTDTFQRSGSTHQIAEVTETAFQQALSAQKYELGSLGYALKARNQYEIQKKIVQDWEQQLASLGISTPISRDSVDQEIKSQLLKRQLEDIKGEFERGLMSLGHFLPEYETAIKQGFIEPSHLEQLEAMEKEVTASKEWEKEANLWNLWKKLGLYYVKKASKEQNPEWLKHFQYSPQ